MRCWIGGIGLIGPGLPNWAAGAPVLAGDAPWTPAEVVLPPPALLPATERRRASQVVRLALALAAEATAGHPDPAGLETIFASGNGDGAVVGSILAALHDPAGVALSPTQFHNSVHNAAAGYWHIAIGSAAPSVSLGGHDGSFAAGLLASATAVATRGRAVLLCAYDLPLVEPLAAMRPTGAGFGCAFVLNPEPGPGSRAMIEVNYVAGPSQAPSADEALDAMVAGNPAAASLPLLRALAARRAAMLQLPLIDDGRLDVRVVPC